jgi:hypothetical protein
MFAVRKMPTAAKRGDELLIRSDGQIVALSLVTAARVVASLDRGDRRRSRLCGLDPGQGISV